jgi:hypothetical protein
MSFERLQAESTAAYVGRIMDAQLAAMGCAVYQVAAKHLQTGKIKTNWVSRTDLAKYVGYLRYLNANGFEIYIRPRECQGLILIDDLGVEAVERLEADGLPPAVLIETSPENYQAWIRVAWGLMKPPQYTAWAKMLANRYGGDPNATAWPRFGRLAGFSHQARRRRDATSSLWWVRLRRTTAGVAPGAAAMASMTKVSSANVAGGRNECAQPGPESLSPGGACDLASEYRQRVERHCERFKEVNDPSRLDWMIACDVAVAHPDITVEQLALTIEGGSPDIQQRKAGHVHEYAMRTAAKVLATVR